MILDSIMSRDPVTISGGASIRDAARRMRDRRIGCLVVAADGRPKGMFTESDLARAVAEGLDLDAKRVVDLMTRPVVTIQATASLSEAVSLMKAKQVRRLVVLVGDELRGVVTVRDLAYAMPGAEVRELDALRFRWQG